MLKKCKSKWEVFIDKGRERTGIDVELDKIVQKLGAGEVHPNSIDSDGTEMGLYRFNKKVNKIAKIPIIIGGGLGKLIHLNLF